MVKKVKYGYCAVTADILHHGHITLLKKCASRCERLIVGVMTDECVYKYKGNKTILSYKERVEIIKSLKFVHKVVPQNNFEFTRCTWLTAFKNLWGKQLIIFDNERHDREMADVLIPYTKGISSTDIKNRIVQLYIRGF